MRCLHFQDIVHLRGELGPNIEQATSSFHEAEHAIWGTIFRHLG